VVVELHPRLRDFIEMICDRDMMRHVLEESRIDVNKMPLGGLSKRTLNSGYKILNQIDGLLKEAKDTGQDITNLRFQARLKDMSNQFYTVIPHQFKVKETPPVIDTANALKDKIELMESLYEYGVANELLDKAEKEKKRKEVDPVVLQYEKLNIDLTPLEKDDEQYKMVEKYVNDTHGGTHYSKVTVVDVFAAEREIETRKYRKSLHCKKLLWHGSRLTNWVGILSQGLRIAPPEAPHAGYMFDKGVYFADMVTKSSNYCWASQAGGKAVLVLCEVACGDHYKRLQSDPAAATACKSRGCHSTWGIGGCHPDPNDYTTLDGEIHVPYGKQTPNTKNIQEAWNDPHARTYGHQNMGAAAAAAAGLQPQSDLLYNEFIVYNTNQIRMRYVVRVDIDESRIAF